MFNLQFCVSTVSFATLDDVLLSNNDQGNLKSGRPNKNAHENQGCSQEKTLRDQDRDEDCKTFSKLRPRPGYFETFALRPTPGKKCCNIKTARI